MRHTKDFGHSIVSEVFSISDNCWKCVFHCMVKVKDISALQSTFAQRDYAVSGHFIHVLCQYAAELSTQQTFSDLNCLAVKELIRTLQVLVDIVANDKSNIKDDPSKDYRMLYDDPILTSLLQKILLTVDASITSIADPYRHDMVAVLGETTGFYAARKIHEKMLRDPHGSIILRKKPRINSETLNYSFLESLPEGTLGHAYMKFFKDNNVTPDSRQPVHFVDDPELAYVIQRYREVHDLVHTLLGMPTNMLGETAVKWVEAIQTGLPVCIAAALLEPLRFCPKQRQKHVTSYLPRAINCGFKVKFLMNVYFEKR